MQLQSATDPIPMLLYCPLCNARHIDEGRFATHPHHTHACQTCGHVWRPAIVPTVGVQFLPGFKDGVQDYRAPVDRHPVRINNCHVCRAIVEWDGSGHERGCPETRHGD